jgi:hypothetical protein
MVTPVTGTALAATVTEHVAVLEPSEVVTVIVAEPALTAVTLPLASTVATPASEDFQLTDLLVALLGDTVAVRDSEPPSLRLTLDLLSETPATETVSGSLGSSLPQPVKDTANIVKASPADMILEMVFFIDLIINLLFLHYSQIYKTIPIRANNQFPVFFVSCEKEKHLWTN